MIYTIFPQQPLCISTKTQAMFSLYLSPSTTNIVPCTAKRNIFIVLSDVLEFLWRRRDPEGQQGLTVDDPPGAD